MNYRYGAAKSPGVKIGHRNHDTFVDDSKADMFLLSSPISLPLKLLFYF